MYTLASPIAASFPADASYGVMITTMGENLELIKLQIKRFTHFVRSPPPTASSMCTHLHVYLAHIQSGAHRVASMNPL